MRKRDRDFVALFNALWYKDFPIVRGHEHLGKRALWTTHISSVIKQCADLMGFFTCFETGNRTDAVIKKASDNIWAKVEWEWKELSDEKINELDKLASAAKEADLMVFVGYSHKNKYANNKKKIHDSWKGIKTPLIVFLITFDKREQKIRKFDKLETFLFKEGKIKMIKRQEAYPWRVEETKWSQAK